MQSKDQSEGQSEDKLPLYTMSIKEPVINNPKKRVFENEEHAVSEVRVGQYKSGRLPKNQNTLLHQMKKVLDKLREIFQNANKIEQLNIKMVIELVKKTIMFRPTDMDKDDIEYLGGVVDFVAEYYPEIISIEPYQINGAINSLSIFGPIKKEVWSKI